MASLTDVQMTAIIPKAIAILASLEFMNSQSAARSSSNKRIENLITVAIAVPAMQKPKISFNLGLYFRND
jgi:hypothetical protein